MWLGREIVMAGLPPLVLQNIIIPRFKGRNRLGLVVELIVLYEVSFESFLLNPFLYNTASPLAQLPILYLAISPVKQCIIFTRILYFLNQLHYTFNICRNLCYARLRAN